MAAVEAATRRSVELGAGGRIEGLGALGAGSAAPAGRRGGTGTWNPSFALLTTSMSRCTGSCGCRRCRIFVDRRSASTRATTRSGSNRANRSGPTRTDRDAALAAIEAWQGEVEPEEGDDEAIVVEALTVGSLDSRRRASGHVARSIAYNHGSLVRVLPCRCSRTANIAGEKRTSSSSRHATVRPSTKVRQALSTVGDRLELTAVTGDKQGRFESLTILAPDDFAALDISYISGPEVLEQGARLAEELAAAGCRAGDQVPLGRLREYDARFDVLHFEQVATPRTRTRKNRTGCSTPARCCWCSTPWPN